MRFSRDFYGQNPEIYGQGPEIYGQGPGGLWAESGKFMGRIRAFRYAFSALSDIMYLSS
jgi:hypothetical protein